MPITPKFSLRQNDTHILVDIRVPHVRVSPEQVQVVITDHAVLHFASPPYLLVLRLGGEDHASESSSSSPRLYYFHETADESCATYDPSLQHGTIHLQLLKAEPGCYWPHLDLVGRFAAPTSSSSRWLVSVQDQQQPMVDEPTSCTDHELVQGSSTLACESEDLPSCSKEAKCFLRRGRGYGFARMFRGIFTDLVRDGLAQEMLEMPWQEEDDPQPNGGRRVHGRRRQQRRDLENSKFDADRYLGDWCEGPYDYIYQCAVAMQPHWRRATPTTTNSVPPSTATRPVPAQADPAPLHHQLSTLSIYNADDDCGHIRPTTIHENHMSSTGPAEDAPLFTEEERVQLLSIPYPLLPDSMLSSSSISSWPKQAELYLGLLDLLFAYVYDHLMTDGEPNVESAWNVSTLSASLSCLEDWLPDDDDGDVTGPGNGSDFHHMEGHHDDEEEASEKHQLECTVRAVILSSIRRSLIYPYLRHVDLALMVWQEVVLILEQGLPMVIRCLLQLRAVVDRSELYYLGNKLFIDPYLAWLQKSAASIDMQTLAREVEVVLRQSNHDRSALKDALGLDLLRIEAQATDIDADAHGEDKENAYEEEGYSSDDDDDDEDDDSDSDLDDTSASSSDDTSEEEDSNKGTASLNDAAVSRATTSDTPTQLSLALENMKLQEPRKPVGALITEIGEHPSGQS